MNLRIFRAFRGRNYRLYFAGQSISLIGTWMQRTAIYWVVYEQTHKPFIIGLAVFCTQFPSFLLSPAGGIASDRYERYRLMLLTQCFSLVQASLLAAVVLFTHWQVWEILALSVMLGIINAFDVPARQGLVYEIVDKKEDLSNAIALNSSMVNSARMIGPAISGIVLEKLGAGFCFSLNALSFLAVILSLLFIRLPKFIPHQQNKKVIKDFKEGWKYLKETPYITNIILQLACISFLVLPFITLLPVYAKVIFKGSASTYGYLNSFIGIGALCGAIFLASLKAGVDLRKVLIINSLIFGIGLILFSKMTNLDLALLFALPAGFGMMSQVTVCMTILQTSVSKEMRGRVISFFAMAYFGMQPLGSLLVGGISQYIGASNTILAEGIMAIIIVLIFLPYIRKDILRERDRIEIVEAEDPSVEEMEK